MFKKAKPQKEAAPVKARRKLTPAEKREIKKIMEAARGDGKPHSAQDTLPFRQIYPDGLCKLDDKSWSRCIEFEDVNYQLAQPDGQTAIFEALCDMYNAHDASIGMELSLVCRKVNKEDFRKRIEIAAQGDRFDGVRALYTDMLRRQLEHGNNGMVKTKFLVLTIEADNIKTARARFSRIVLDALNHFKAMGALAKDLNGKEWLEVLHGVLHPDGDRFRFEWDWLAPSGLHVKDFICPSSFRFGEARRFQMGGKFGAVSFLQLTAPEMNDRLLADLLDTDSTILVSLHIRSMDQNEAIKTVKRKITDLDSMKIDAQKRAAREGFDMDIIPSDLATYAGEAKNILRDLQSRNERMFLMTFLVVNIADTKQKLDNDVFRASSVAQKYNCQLTRLDFQQEQGLVSALPLGVNQIKIQRGLGNREDLFPSSSYVAKYTNPPTTYDIPASALEDETFAALITEAEKYIGYPYVWGGSNPNTSFDCSGFVSWALTESGVCNTGRLGAQGLYNISTPVSSANARPGDLIFFVGTYDTPSVSHVGIYVGGGKMLHCGDPIQYADINTSYWQSHFYAFGRPPCD